MAARDLRSTAGANNRLILNATGLDAATATSQQVRSELRAREEPMTEGEQAVALELTSLLEDRAMMNDQGLDTRLISQQIGDLCKN